MRRGPLAAVVYLRRLPTRGQAQPGSPPQAAPALATPKPNPAASSTPAWGQAPIDSRFSQKMLRQLPAPSLPPWHSHGIRPAHSQLWAPPPSLTCSIFPACTQ